MMRKRLPNRRGHEVLAFQHDGQNFTAGIGRFPDGRLAEVFINGAKFGSAAEASAQEAAMVASLALQHGCQVETIRHALTRGHAAGGPLGALLAVLEGGK
jgi:hypothetical protein